ncbi:rRNA maturation RNase YbeY [Patescibacteria group bacterium]|nr:rRNA maturation RNase YbeY [Patescibacteria group bacterium]MBU1778141.1 rRNA maturation RNase YbeY [Patescibacteria group bacterium]MBU1987468.1 rRNA maturation RNase YbeY [Patescibacteria group bacterium]MBU2415648.1 rRNA maturation RNase YbeY [Patescibacteria group bacterium]
MNIEINNKTRNTINTSLIKKVVKNFLAKYKKNNHTVSIAFVGDKTMRTLNKQYREIDKITDVMAFPGNVLIKDFIKPEKKNLGEVIINYAQIKRQSRKFNNSIDQELIFILVHGLLHLLNYNDTTEKGRKEMEKLGEAIINDQFSMINSPC